MDSLLSLRRHTWLASALLVLATCSALGVLVAQGRSDATASGEPAPVAATLDGIPQHGDTLGSPDAPNVLVLYVDPDCVSCGELYWGILPELIDRRVRSRSLRIIVRPVTTPGAPSHAIRETYAAGLQNRMFQYLLAYDLLKLRGDDPMAVARAVRGLDDVRVRRDADSAEVTNSIGEAEARARRIRATPPAMFFDPAGRGSVDVQRVELDEPAAVVVAELDRLVTRSG